MVNHIDGNPSNNSLDNLEWCTQKENINKAHKETHCKKSGHIQNAKLDIACEILARCNGKFDTKEKWVEFINKEAKKRHKRETALSRNLNYGICEICKKEKLLSDDFTPSLVYDYSGNLKIIEKVCNECIRTHKI